jgi:hypothetical protein
MIGDERAAPAREARALEAEEDAVRQYLVSLKGSAAQGSASCGLKARHAEPDDSLSAERRHGGPASKRRGANSRPHEHEHRAR